MADVACAAFSLARCRGCSRCVCRESFGTTLKLAFPSRRRRCRITADAVVGLRNYLGIVRPDCGVDFARPDYDRQFVDRQLNTNRHSNAWRDSATFIAKSDHSRAQFRSALVGARDVCLSGWIHNDVFATGAVFDRRLAFPKEVWRRSACNQSSSRCALETDRPLRRTSVAML